MTVPTLTSQHFPQRSSSTKPQAGPVLPGPLTQDSRTFQTLCAEKGWGVCMSVSTRRLGSGDHDGSPPEKGEPRSSNDSNKSCRLKIPLGLEGTCSERSRLRGLWVRTALPLASYSSGITPKIPQSIVASFSQAPESSSLSCWFIFWRLCPLLCSLKDILGILHISGSQFPSKTKTALVVTHSKKMVCLFQ